MILRNMVIQWEINVDIVGYIYIMISGNLTRLGGIELETCKWMFAAGKLLN
jgi:hypothetical protein